MRGAASQRADSFDQLCECEEEERPHEQQTREPLRRNVREPPPLSREQRKNGRAESDHAVAAGVASSPPRGGGDDGDRGDNRHERDGESDRPERVERRLRPFHRESLAAVALRSPR